MTKPGKAATGAGWRKSPADLIDLFASVLPDAPNVEKRQMFGYPCAFVNGNMFTGLHQEALIVRLDEEHRKQLIDEAGAWQFEPIPGRPMREYVALPDAVLEDRGKLTEVITSAMEFAASLPPKVKKPRKKKTTGLR
ncbi:TfoX/Sxy family protein [Anderseniella sp. Alg231-50]|uniref:TfoX/Sxy family protein n=1 Tax=Anderseniella sp. Alg231-50 TaxID=1922226 RepID=UPI000D560F81